MAAGVNSSMSKWKAVMSGAPQGLALGSMLCNIFGGDTDDGTEGALSKAVNNTRLSGVVNTLEGRDAMQRKLDRLPCT